MPTCKYCGVIKPTSSAVKKHIQLTLSCRSIYLDELSQTARTTADSEDSLDGEISYGISMTEETSMCSQLADDTPVVDNAPLDGSTSIKWNDPAEWPRYSEAYPDAAGMPISSVPEKTRFEAICESEGQKGPWSGSFESEEEWDLAKWLLRNTGQNQIEQFLKLPKVLSNECHIH
jgi:hypothetical protein